MSIDFNNQKHPDDGLLENARMNASKEWEVHFVDDMLDKRAAFGLLFRLTERQRYKLKEIAEGSEVRRPPRWRRRR